MTTPPTSYFSFQEWQELISYACDTLGQTLLNSILEKIQNSRLRLQSDQSECRQVTKDTMDDVTPHTNNKETGLAGSLEQGDVDGMCIESVGDLLLKLRELQCADDDSKPKTRKQPKLERTASLPPLNHHQLTPRPQQQHSSTSQHAAYLEAEAGDHRDLDEDGSLYTRSRSHGESDYRHSSRHRTARRERKCNNKCSEEDENRYHLGHSSRKKKRSRSDGKRDSGVTRVDPSLDDDCPGVLENRVRRPRHHQHLCKQCSGVERGGRNKGGGGAVPMPTSSGRKGWEGDHVIPSGWTRGGNDGPTLVMTLEDVQRAALLLERSAEFVESGEEEVLGDENYTTQVHPQTVSALLGSVNPLSTRDMDDGSESGRAEANFHWRDMPYTSLPSRSGRDSPATDMAVACLDMNSERMLRPLNMSRSMEWRAGTVCEAAVGGSYQQHLHLHNHHHYHHIIHHHSQP